MFVNLPDHCLRTICNELNLIDQMSLSVTCKHLRYIVGSIRRDNKPFIMGTRLWNYIYGHQEDFKCFMSAISGNIKDIELPSMNPLRLELLTNLNFSKLKRFVISFRDINDRNIATNFYRLVKSLNQNLEEFLVTTINHEMLCAIKDLRFPNVKICKLFLVRINYDPERIRESDLISSIFPNVTSLSFATDTLGQNLWEIKNLTELTLINCSNFPAEFVNRALGVLPLRKFSIRPMDDIGCFEGENYFHNLHNCPTIEEIDVEYHHLLFVIDKFSAIKKLRKLSFSPKEMCGCEHRPNSFLPEISDFFKHIHSLIFYKTPFNIALEEYIPFIKSLKNLQKLAICESSLSHEILDEIAPSLAGSLKEFRCKNLKINKDANLLYLIAILKCHNLELFDISCGIADKDFLRIALETLSIEHKWRTKPLVICCFKTKITKEHLKEFPIPEFVEITFDEIPFTYPTMESVVCEWEVMPEIENLSVS